jgi:hypothetical protein
MNELDDHRKGNMVLSLIPTQFGTQEQQGRPKSLAAAEDEMSGNFSDQWDTRSESLIEFILNALKIVTDKQQHCFHADFAPHQ